MRSLKVVVVLLAIVGVSSIASASLFVDDFESYAAGSSLHGQGGWKGWDNDPTWTAYASDVQANSGSISAAIDGSADLVHEFDFAGGKLELSAMQYIPVGGTGQSFFLLLNQYNDDGPYDWSVQLNCDMDTGQITSDFGGGSSLPIKWGEWVQLKFVIDLVANNVDEYYDGTLLSSHQWDDTWNGTLECIDLFGNDASSIYYDDITVGPHLIYNTTQDRWYESIQSAIDDAYDGDEIEVGPGTYYEAIDFNGKSVHLYSSDGPNVTTIDASGLGSSVVSCLSEEDANTILEGFTITGGNAYLGGGMYNYYSSPTVTNCRFISNAASLHGGGMHNEHSDPTVTNCIFSGNTATAHGGGMMNNYGSVSYTVNCVFIGNTANGKGGGCCNSYCSPYFINCTFYGNTAVSDGGAIYSDGSYTNIQNCIFWNDSTNEIAYSSSSMSVTYSDIQGGWGGTGNINTDPLFVDMETENLRLGWGSPCVDAGNNDAVPGDVTTDLDGNPRFADDTGIPDTGYGTAPIVDMGAYERQIDSIGPIRNVTQGFYYLQIQAAIDAALDGDQIEVAPGTYEEVINFYGKSVHLYSSDGPEFTTIDGTGNYHVVQCVSGEDANSILEGFTITGGNASGLYPDDRGGGMYNYQSSPTVTDCIFTGNVADYGGAGMGNENNSNPIVTSCTFNGNIAYGGGGMGNENNSNPIVTNCTFSANTASYSGGGMGNVSSSPTVTGCTFSDNTASEFGGGMYNFDSSPTVENCTFSGNETLGTASETGGGGMYNYQSSPTVYDCTFTNNTSMTFGGGMRNESSSPTVTNCNFSGNSADFGGGMYNMMESNPTVTNCTFSNNWATCEGGGMRNESSSPTVTNCNFSGNSADFGGGMHNMIESNPTVTNCTFSGNSANYGGGMHNMMESNPTVTNCIFWNDIPDEIVDIELSAIVTFSDIQGGWSGTGNIDADPLFVDAAGGNLRLSDFSPCVDSGNNDAVPTGVTTDLGGNPRFADDAGIPDTGYGSAPIVDMGAYERQIDSIGPICNVTQGFYYLQIQAAIDEAFDGDQIEVSPGTYYEAIIFLGKSVHLYSSGGPEVTTIDGTGYLHVVQCVSGEGPGTILEGFTITGGNVAFGGGMRNDGSSPTVTDCTFSGNTATYGGGGIGNIDSSPTVTNCTFSGNSADIGGGMYNSSSSPAVTNCTFSGNTASLYGGGMFNDTNSSPTLTGCTFSGNSADFGGGMYNYDSDPIVTNCTFSGNSADFGGGMNNFDNSSPMVTNCTFSNNWATCEGGGMRNEMFSSPTVTNCTFSGNSAGFGGGMFNSGSSPTVTNCIFSSNTGNGMSNVSSSPTVTECIFTGNTATQHGGGIFNEASSSPMVSDCSFSSNIAAYSGGGMYSKNGSSPIVENCTFSGNQANGDTTAMGGGGMCNAWYCSPTVTNCTFTGNTATYGGGGIASSNNCSGTVTNCTFTNNDANTGGGMYNYNSSPTVTNCTFTGNTVGESGGGMWNHGSMATLTNCILWGDSPNEISNDETSSTTATYSNVGGGYAGTGNIDADPFFVDAAGGDLRLGFGSPCIDAGDNTAVPSDVLKDLAGKLRFVDDPSTDDTGNDGMTGRPVVDMGAYEFHGCGIIAQNHMANPGFETGDATGWMANWGLAADTNQAHEGDYSGLTSGRMATWDGAWQSLLGLMDDGKTYRISGWVRLKEATSDYVALTVKKVDSTGDHYYNIDNATVSDQQWVHLDGTFALDVVGELTDLYIYFEGPEPGVDFYVDDASVTEVMGDMDHNGGVDLIDFGIFASYYGFDCSAQDCGLANFNDCDNNINELDLAILCSNWLVGAE